MIYGDGGHAKVIKEFWNDEHRWIVAVGDNAARKREVERWAKDGVWFGVAIHPKASVSKRAEIGLGTVIMDGSIVQAGAVVGKHCIINTGATVDHDCVLENYVHIAPGAHLCGGVKVGEGSLVGVGVGIAPLAVIPPWSLVKARRLEIEPLPSHG